MPTIRYSYEQPYYPVVGAGLQPALAVRLILGGATAQAVGILDTGSTVTVFNSEVAALLGIDDIFDGDAVVASTQAGSVEFYQFDLEMEILLMRSVTNKFPARVGFLAAPRARNILGRNIVFGHYQFGIRERTNTIYLEPEG